MKLKFWSAISVVVGCVIGSGVFVKPGRVLEATGSANLALMAWVIGGLISLAGGLTVAEIGTRIPRSGGVYAYMEYLFGKEVGFICGWVQTFLYGPGLLAALSLYFASLFAQSVGLDDSLLKPIALAALFILSAISAVGTHFSAWIQNATTLAKLLPIFAIGIIGLFLGKESFIDHEFVAVSKTAGMGTAVLATLWAYDGWMQVANISGEIERPEKNLPKAIIFGILSVMLIYVLVNIALFHTLNINEVAKLNERAASVAAETLFGPIGGGVLALGILISIFGCLNGSILTMTRLPFTMAQNSHFPIREKMAALHPRFGTPVNSIALKVACSTLMILLMNPDRITDLAIFSMYLIYLFCFIGIFKIRKEFGRPEKGSYKIPLYPLVPIVAIAGCMFICYGMIAQSPMDAAISLSITVAGLPVYLWLKRASAITNASRRFHPLKKINRILPATTTTR